MKNINIAATLAHKRKEKGITQDELARYMGVSKASVSKWETGISYPDIAFLPQLATYFDISIDELLAYDPQMSPDGIRGLYRRLTEQVNTRPFSETLEECRTIIKEYFSCYPLLLQVSMFLINNATLADGPDGQAAVIREAAGLLQRIREESDDTELAHRALAFEAYCHLGLGEPDMTLMLLEETALAPAIPTDIIVSGAYQMKGNVEEAQRAVQVGLFQNVVIQFNYLPNYLTLVTDDKDAFDETLHRARLVADAYRLDSLHPALLLSLEMTAAMGYATMGETGLSLDSLERTARLLADNTDNLSLHSDAFFTLITPWIEELDNGSELPRNTALVESEFADVVSSHPAFSSLEGEPRFAAVKEKFTRIKEQNNG